MTALEFQQQYWLNIRHECLYLTIPFMRMLDSTRLRYRKGAFRRWMSPPAPPSLVTPFCLSPTWATNTGYISIYQRKKRNQTAGQRRSSRAVGGTAHSFALYITWYSFFTILPHTHHMEEQKLSYYKNAKMMNHLRYHRSKSDTKQNHYQKFCPSQWPHRYGLFHFLLR